jgi:hypothetical protein
MRLAPAFDPNVTWIAPHMNPQQRRMAEKAAKHAKMRAWVANF